MDLVLNSKRTSDCSGPRYCGGCNSFGLARVILVRDGPRSWCLVAPLSSFLHALILFSSFLLDADGHLLFFVRLLPAFLILSLGFLFFFARLLCFCRGFIFYSFLARLLCFCRIGSIFFDFLNQFRVMKAIMVRLEYFVNYKSSEALAHLLSYSIRPTQSLTS